MPKTPWDSFKHLMEIRKRMNELLQESLAHFDLMPEMQSDSQRWRPPFDLVEVQDAYILYGELPGVKKEDIDIQLNGSQLIISGERRPSKDTQQVSFFQAERRYGAFTRHFELPTTIDHDKIETAFTNGLLEVTLRKPEARRISIK